MFGLAKLPANSSLGSNTVALPSSAVVQLSLAFTELRQGTCPSRLVNGDSMDNVVGATGRVISLRTRIAQAAAAEVDDDVAEIPIVSSKSHNQIPLAHGRGT